MKRRTRTQTKSRKRKDTRQNMKRTRIQQGRRGPQRETQTTVTRKLRARQEPQSRQEHRQTTGTKTEWARRHPHTRKGAMKRRTKPARQRRARERARGSRRRTSKRMRNDLSRGTRSRTSSPAGPRQMIRRGRPTQTCRRWKGRKRAKQTERRALGSTQTQTKPTKRTRAQSGGCSQPYAQKKLRETLEATRTQAAPRMNDDIQMRRRQTQRTRAMSRRSQSPTRTPNIRRKPGRNEAR